MKTRLEVLMPIGLGVILAVAVIFLLATNVNKTKKDFQGELAKRLDAEEKLLRAENERAAMASQLESLRSQLAEKKKESAGLSAELEKVRREKTVVEEALAKMKFESSGASAAAPQEGATAAP